MHFLSTIKFYANLSLVSLSLLTFAHATPQESAGIVTFMLGKAYLNNELVHVGTEINQGDTLETLSNGHVHIRFVDDALVSVRPSSKLSIDHYAYNAQTPSESVIKFDLKEGIIRSISGKGAKSARDKFRLNTPIAAIGVRGTDFVVKASNKLVQAVVNEGAIAVAPFSSSCDASAFGPCSEAVELDGTSKQLLELNTLYSTPRLIPLSASIELASELFKSELTNSQSNTEDTETESSEKDQNAKDSSNNTNNAKSNSGTDTTSGTSNNSSSFDSPFSEAMSETEVKQIIADHVAKNSVDQLTTSPVSTKLAWGRFSSFGKVYQDTKNDTLIYESYLDAAEGRESLPVAALLGAANGLPNATALFRSGSDRSSIDYSLGNVDFDLKASQVNLYMPDGGVEEMDITDSFLSVDFTKGSFNTGLTLNSLITSKVKFNMSGSINSNGELFPGSSDSTRHFSGATTLEGDEAGYLFYKEIEAGMIEGATIWH
ncbi:FecR family protein [Marinomonas fungiae]|uniref:FecR family protein n=1 Tax=Marinomonas fungiae TaxID=1137284 RepID=A0A0K6II26_9GAMM|nr:FecR family protein [Marinomonas fungiae]CUB02760.1 FecR family protein [Marinomonas fungiae]